jgi:hypothetical protein
MPKNTTFTASFSKPAFQIYKTPFKKILKYAQIEKLINLGK